MNETIEREQINERTRQQCSGVWQGSPPAPYHNEGPLQPENADKLSGGHAAQQYQSIHSSQARKLRQAGHTDINVPAHRVDDRVERHRAKGQRRQHRLGTRRQHGLTTSSGKRQQLSPKERKQRAERNQCTKSECTAQIQRHYLRPTKSDEGGGGDDD
jgi:hypothetical protein